MNPKPDFKPAEVFVVDDLDTLKVLADPLRLKIRELMYQPTTVKQVAAELDMVPTKLYYHIDKLEKHELIVLVDTRVVSGIIEKHYQVSAWHVRVAKQLLSPDEPSGEGLDIAVNTFFDTARDDLMEAVENGSVEWDDDGERHKGLSLHTGTMRLTEEQAADLYREVEAIFRRYAELDEQQQHRTDDTNRYRTFYALFPQDDTKE